MSRRGGVAACVALLLVLVWGLRVAWLALDETAAPDAEVLPAVPAGAEQLSVGTQCASGGCWQELRLRPDPGTSGDRLVEALGLSRERCTRAPLLDPRSTCSGARVRGDGVVVVYAAYQW